MSKGKWKKGKVFSIGRDNTTSLDLCAFNPGGERPKISNGVWNRNYFGVISYKSVRRVLGLILRKGDLAEVRIEYRIVEKNKPKPK